MPSAPSRPPTATWRRPSSGSARRAWRRGQARRAREHARARWRCSSTATAAALVEAQERDRLRRLVGALQEAGQRPRRAVVAQSGDDAVAQRAKELEDLRITLKENIELGDGRADRGGRRRRARLLPPRPGRPGRQRRARRAGRRHARAGPRHRRAHRLRPARSTCAASDVPAEVVEQERATLESHHPQRGQARAGHAEDRRGPPQRLLQGRSCLLEQPYAKDDKQTIKQLLGGAKIVRFAQVEIG